MTDKEGRYFFFSDDFKETAANHYYVDKSLFLKDFLDDHPAVSLITRPRRFGKSLNLNMARTFFEKSEEDTSVYFKDLKIWKCKEKYTSQQGKYPVVYLDFSSTDRSNWNEAYIRLKDIIVDEYKAHKELKGNVSEADSDEYARIVKGIGDESDYAGSLALLLKLLHAHHGIKPVVLIDEYDAPIESGYDRGYYEEAVSFMRDFFSKGLSGDDFSFAIIMGVVRIPNEDIFPGVDDLVSYSVSNDRYGEYFGFTKDEVKDIFDDFGHPEKYGEVMEWYDGYLFGDADVLNPWSVESYLEYDFKPSSYWARTASLGELFSVFKDNPDEAETALKLLSSGNKIPVEIREDVSYDKLLNGENVFSLLFESGYLTSCGASCDERKSLKPGERLLAVPNKEVMLAFEKELRNHRTKG